MIVNIIVNISFFGFRKCIAIAKNLFTLIVNHNIVLVPEKEKKKLRLSYMLIFMAKFYVEFILKVQETVEQKLLIYSLCNSGIS